MKKTLIILCYSGLFIHLWASNVAFSDFIKSTNLTYFSDHLLEYEKDNLNQFSKEISNFTCLSNRGKQIALQEIQILQTQAFKDSSSFKQNIQVTMQNYLKQTLTKKDIEDLAFLMKSTYGQRLTKILKENHTDIINNPSILIQNPDMLPNSHEIKELSKQQNSLDLLHQVASNETKKNILLQIGNENYSQKLQEGIKRLQEIFMQEGCAIE